MTYGGAAGETARQMAGTLHFTLAAEKLHPAFAGLLKQLNAPAQVGTGEDRRPAYQLAVANALWGQKGYAFKADFIQLLRRSYGAGLREVDFFQTEQARQTINGWVTRQTKDKIKDLIPQDCLGQDTRLVLTNAIYFKSRWQYEFRKDATAKGSFKLLTGKSMDVPLMYQKANLGYMDNGDLQLLELPYVDHEASMVIVLPKAPDGLAGVERQLSAASLGRWLRAARTVEVSVALPRFTFSMETMLAETLKEMGMTDAFDAEKADFSGMADKPLFLAHVIHKAFIAVEEEGTEAAAATAVDPTELADPETKTFYADHPFLFLIRHNATGEILFMGRLTIPGEPRAGGRR